MPDLLPHCDDDGSSSEDDDDPEEVVPVHAGRLTRSLMPMQMRAGRTRSQTAAMNATEGAENAEQDPEDTEVDPEQGLVGAGLGGGFQNTAELHVMTFDQAMATPEADAWLESVEEEHERMERAEVFRCISRGDLPSNAKVLTSTWAMKKKASGRKRARINARGFEQIDGIHYDKDTVAAPTVTETTVRVIFILMLMARFTAEVIDVKGAFLQGTFDQGERLYMEVPKGFEKFYPPNSVLLLLKTIYGLKQAAYAFWTKLLAAFSRLNYHRSKADPCLYYKWSDRGLILWTSWVDDLLSVGEASLVSREKERMKTEFDCDDQGLMEEYVGCKIDIDWDRDKPRLKFTQPVLLQSLEDEFDIQNQQECRTPAEPGSVLRKPPEETLLDREAHSKYRSAVGKLLYLMRWSRPDILNPVRELSKFVSTGPGEAQEKALKRVMKYCVATKDRGLTLEPNESWDGNKDFKFKIKGRSDLDHAKVPDSRRSVTGYTTFLCGAPVTMKSRMQQSVSLSVASSEGNSAVDCVQDMLFVMQLLESLELQVEKPMILEVDNKAVKDLANNWSVNGRTRHEAVKQSFIRELKEAGTLRVVWIPTEDNSSDMFTKNLHGPDFDRHMRTYVTDKWPKRDNENKSS